MATFWLVRWMVSKSYSGGSGPMGTYNGSRSVVCNPVRIAGGVRIVVRVDKSAKRTALERVENP